jgi:hypothetical protein
MIPRMISGATHVLGAPAGWDHARDGHCGKLAIRAAEGCCLSAWEPTPEELAILSAGGSVILQVVGGQPPVMLWAEPSVGGEGSDG